MKTLQEQIDKFYEETGYRLEVKDGKAYYKDSLYLKYRHITKLPDNLVVGGSLYLGYTGIDKLPNNLVVGDWLDLRCTEIAELPDNLVVGGWLDLSNTKITKLPENLVVGGFLDLFGTKITKLPDNLVVGNYLNLYNTKITKLPDNLVIGGSLDLRCTEIVELPDNLVVGCGFSLIGTKITKLPDNLVVGGYLDLYDTPITELPQNLAVGGWLDLGCTKVSKLPEDLAIGGNIFGMSNTPITMTLTQEAKKKLQKIENFLQWNVGGKTYIKVDDIFSVVDSHRGNVWVTHLIGKDETLYVVTDGEGHYAHGATLKEAKDDLIYKINDRDTSLYANLSLDDEISFDEAIAMYRTITGACAAGTQDFVKNRLPEPHKKMYTIKEIIALTDDEYGNAKLKEFFQCK